MVIVEGIVRAQLPSGLYDVEIEGLPRAESRGTRRVKAHAGGGVDRNFIRLLVGDRVVVELTEKDLTRGRIVRKA